jgi:tetratricopeptide (TPR) repeat protein
MVSRRRLPVPLVLTMFMAASTTVLERGMPALAAEDSVSAMRVHFERGQTHYDLGEFGKALEEFREAYRLKDDPALLFNIGQCQVKLGDDNGALYSYRSYLRRDPKGPNRNVAEAKIADIQKRIGAMSPSHAVSSGAAPLPSGVPPVVPPPVVPALSQAASRTGPAWQPAPNPALVLDSPAPAPVSDTAGTDDGRRPLIRQWWFWTAIAAAAALGTVGVLAATSGHTDVPGTTLGAQHGF